MNNQKKFEFIKEHWQLRDGIVYSKRTNNPVSFASKNDKGRRFQSIEIKGERHKVYIHNAIFMLHHNRPIADGKEIHHINGDYEDNAVDNLAELTRTQHRRIHQFQCNDPMRGVSLDQGAWRFQWIGDDGKHTSRRFHSINDAMNFRAEIEEPRRKELRLLGLNCRKKYRGVTLSQLRKISRKQNSRLFRTHI